MESEAHKPQILPFQIHTERKKEDILIKRPKAESINYQASLGSWRRYAQETILPSTRSQNRVSQAKPEILLPPIHRLPTHYQLPLSRKLTDFKLYARVQGFQCRHHSVRLYASQLGKETQMVPDLPWPMPQAQTLLWIKKDMKGVRLLTWRQEGPGLACESFLWEPFPCSRDSLQRN